MDITRGFISSDLGVFVPLLSGFDTHVQPGEILWRLCFEIVDVAIIAIDQRKWCRDAMQHLGMSLPALAPPVR